MSALGAAVPLGALDGCALFRPDPAQLCERPDTAGRDLLIDIHAHVFNGSDLQIADFISNLTGYLDGVWQDALKHIGGLLQHAAWHRAPWGPDELKMLNGVQCGVPSLGPRGLRAQGYATALQTLEQAAEETLRRQKAGYDDRKSVYTVTAQDTFERLKRTPYEEYERQRRERARAGENAPLAPLEKTVASLYDFVIQHFQHRFANAVEYFDRYEADGQPPVDLLVTSFLDFDHWISQGRSTPTTLQQQIEVMERISVLTGGRVHSFVPYCPLREIRTGGGKRGTHGESLRWVEDAILKRGFIGVKIYPPMGFAPYGNAKLDPKTWRNKPWLPDIAAQPGFGEMLDGALAVFYEWCIENDVPVMAHTSATNAMHKDFEELPGPVYWRQALQKFDRLRVNLGHIGGNKTDAGAPQAVDFVRLLPHAANAHADIGYFFDVVDHPKTLTDSMRGIFETDSLSRGRLMYGSDYQMIVSERGWGRYQQAFRDLIRAMPDPEYLERNFFGNNAANYLGLHAAPPGKRNNRSRLEAYYRDNQMPKPAWMAKVDAISIGPR